MASCMECIHFNPCNSHGKIIVEKPTEGNDWGLHNKVENECKYFTPAADVVEVRHGEWVYNTDDFTPKMRCSVCGYNKPLIAGENIKQEPNNYCNECGAKMDGEKRSDT